MKLTLNNSTFIDVFALDKIDRRLGGYFIDKEGRVYSTRNKSKSLAVMLNGSQPSRKSLGPLAPRFYSLIGRSYRGSDLIRMAKQHKDFYTDVGVITVTPAAPAPVKTKQGDRAWAASLELGIKGKGVIIGSLCPVDGGVTLVLAQSPKVHLTEASWKAEIERLAKEMPGVKFVALQVVRTCVAGGVTFE